jgi:hypothetical protein
MEVEEEEEEAKSQSQTSTMKMMKPGRTSKTSKNLPFQTLAPVRALAAKVLLVFTLA